MPLKRDFLKRLNLAIIISIIIFIVSIGVYFYISSQTRVNAIRESLAILRSILKDNSGIITSVLENVKALNFLFVTQLITLFVSIFALLSSVWYTTHRYLIEKRNALIDPLTRIYNRKAVFFSLEGELRKSERYGHPTSLALIDLDFFKKYNDTQGHVAGDRLLLRFANLLKETLREYDIYGRYGGEEFIIIFPETQATDAFEVCERLRKLIEETHFPGQEDMPFKKITISIGISEVKGKRKITAEEMIHHADELLYKAKSEGRNRVLYEKIKPLG